MIVNKSGKELECGVDEAGRGSFFGRLYVGAVIFSHEVELDPNIVKDSKKFCSRKTRARARDYILEKCLYSHVAYVEPDVIDRDGVGVCVMKTMRQAIEGLEVKPDHLLIDGDKFDGCGDIPYETIVGGDNKYFSIAAASILAKVAHDEHITMICQEHPELAEYGLEKSMGYGTKVHRDAIKKLGCSQWHRKTFCENTLGLRKKVDPKLCLI